MVTCDGKGISNVVVTDGLRCVTTDRNGFFQFLNFRRYALCVYFTPAGYLTECSQTIPRFIERLI